MEHVRSFTGFPGLADMQQFLAGTQEEDHPFQTSELYSSKVDAKIVDEELRRSKFRILEEPALFDMVDAVIQWLNKSDATFAYHLRRDNITETRYEEGGHFLKHKVSNGATCLYMVFTFCVECSCVLHRLRRCTTGC